MAFESGHFFGELTLQAALRWVRPPDDSCELMRIGKGDDACPSPRTYVVRLFTAYLWGRTSDTNGLGDHIFSPREETGSYLILLLTRKEAHPRLSSQDRQGPSRRW